GVFFLFSYFCYWRYRAKRQSKYLIGSLLLFVLAAYSKETALSLVALIFVSDWLESGKLAAGSALPAALASTSKRVQRALLATLSYVGVAALYLVPRYRVLGGLTWYNPHAYHGPFLHTLLTLPWVVCTYLLHLLFPVNLSIAYDTSFETSVASARFLLPAL